MARSRILRPALLVGAGAALAYLFDPERGTARRHQLRDQALARARRTAGDVDRQARFTQGRVEGMAARAHGGGEFHPESQTDLREHLRQVVAEQPFATNDVTVDVVDGVAALRGQVGTPEEINALRSVVAGVDGVDRVESYLHLPGTPAPNKAEAMQAG
jgi:osmotically-inducible protein OsmY